MKGLILIMPVTNPASKKIVVIDDEDFYRELLAEWLTEEGWLVLCAKNGKEGESLGCQPDIALIITDIFMPDMDGVEFVQKIRGDNLKVPILAISGNQSNCDYLNVMKRLGASRVLKKIEINKEKLIAVIKEMI